MPITQQTTWKSFPSPSARPPAKIVILWRRRSQKTFFFWPISRQLFSGRRRRTAKLFHTAPFDERREIWSDDPLASSSSSSFVKPKKNQAGSEERWRDGRRMLIFWCLKLITTQFLFSMRMIRRSMGFVCVCVCEWFGAGGKHQRPTKPQTKLDMRAREIVERKKSLACLLLFFAKWRSQTRLRHSISSPCSLHLIPILFLVNASFLFSAGVKEEEEDQDEKEGAKKWATRTIFWVWIGILIRQVKMMNKPIEEEFFLLFWQLFKSMDGWIDGQWGFGGGGLA